eukprot:scaffold80665_cov28-Tisochrysis_lutea.AAC.1
MEGVQKEEVEKAAEVVMEGVERRKVALVAEVMTEWVTSVKRLLEEGRMVKVVGEAVERRRVVKMEVARVDKKGRRLVVRVMTDTDGERGRVVGLLVELEGGM